MKVVSCLALTLAWGALSALAPSAARAEVKLPALFSDHMVAQAGKELPVWGWAAPGEKITVTLAGQTSATTAGQDGNWKVKLAPLKSAEDPQTLTVTGTNTLTVKDVLIGEVWLASGQSNMAMKVGSAQNFEKEQPAATYPQIRMFTEASRGAATPQKECSGAWVVCSPETVGGFSATGYFFARDIHRAMKTPVGVINSSVGGTLIEAWTAREAQEATPALKDMLARVEKLKAEFDPKARSAEHAAAMVKWEAAAKEARLKKTPLPSKPRDPVETHNKEVNLGHLFNGKIAPLIPYALKGIIWYQGESNASAGRAGFYETQLKLLITDWRARWGAGLPFAWVQLPNILRGDAWVAVREAQLRTLELPDTGMAVTIDVGDAADVHPKNKQTVGHRLALWALGTVYGKKIEPSGPRLTGHRTINGQVELTFSHATGLHAKTGTVTGFTIAGADKRFKSAIAKIEGGKVLVSHPDIPEPVAARYAWKDLPEPSLYNAAKLPASPFRTDDWTDTSLTDVRLPAIFGDHMVLQADSGIPVWGFAPAGDEISVTLAAETKTTKSSANGKWRVAMNKVKASSDPMTLTVKSPRNTITLKDVLVGEVWIASGQSNMEFRFSRGEYPAAEKAAAAHPGLRIFTVTKNAQRKPQVDCEGAWVVTSPDTVDNFSAVAYFFGRDLHLKLGRPVGMINTSWGGTDVAAWTSEEAQARVPVLKAKLDQWAREDSAYDLNIARANLEKAMEGYKVRLEKARAAGAAKMPPKPQLVLQPRTEPNYPANLYNGMIAPLIPYAFRGAIWYQGEHNCPTLEKATLYKQQLPLLISDWRARWRRDFPFAWVQLPNFDQTGFRPLVREAMLQTLSTVKNTGMAITMDVGESNDNHPKNKPEVGRRLALWALGAVYHQEVPAISGPLPAGHEVRDGSMVLKFTHASGGLVAKGGGELKGFVIAGEDKVWKPGTARIEGETVIVSSPGVAKPAAVRFAWDDDPEFNLYNGAGLPASPFRTDDWEVESTKTSIQ